MAAGIVEIQGLHPGGANLADGSVRVVCQENLQDMVRSLTLRQPMNSIEVLRITSPGIIAILIGLLLPAKKAEAQSLLGNVPALNKIKDTAKESDLGKFLPGASQVREAASQPGLGNLFGKLGEGVAHLPSNFLPSNFNQPLSDSEPAEILPYIEVAALGILRPYFAHGAHVELRSNIAVGELSHDKLTQLAKAFGVPILIGTAPAGSAGWAGPVTKATPGGLIQKV